MSAIRFLRILWKRLAMVLSPSSIRIDGIWDHGRLYTECRAELTAWKNVLLLHPRREALNNGVVVTKVQHLKNNSEQHEFLRFYVLHEASKESATFLIDRDVWPKDFEGPPRPYKGIIGPETEKDKKKPFKSRMIKSRMKRGEESKLSTDFNRTPGKKDVPEEGELNLKITHLSGEIMYCSDSVLPSHKVLDRVHRGVGDLENWLSPSTLGLQTLTFPECARPSVLKVAFFLSALSEFAPRHHVGEYQSYWFARAACDGLHATFRGKLKAGRDFRAMGKWQAASFKYINPTVSVVVDYNQQLQQFEDAFKTIQSEGRQLGGVEEGHQLSIEFGRQEGIEERRRLEVEIEQRMVERRRLEEEIANLHADLAAR